MGDPSETLFFFIEKINKGKMGEGGGISEEGNAIFVLF